MAYALYAVPVWEHERGWGSKIDDYMCLATEEAAKAWAVEFNSENKSATVPDWYMRADADAIALREVTAAQLKRVKAAGKMWWSSLNRPQVKAKADG